MLDKWRLNNAEQTQVSKTCWCILGCGHDRTKDGAIANMVKANNGHKPKSYDVYTCHEDTNVNGLGDFQYPRGSYAGEYAPKLIERVRGGKVSTSV